MVQRFVLAGFVHAGRIGTDPDQHVLESFSERDGPEVSPQRATALTAQRSHGARALAMVSGFAQVNAPGTRTCTRTELGRHDRTAAGGFG